MIFVLTSNITVLGGGCDPCIGGGSDSTMLDNGVVIPAITIFSPLILTSSLAVEPPSKPVISFNERGSIRERLL